MAGRDNRCNGSYWAIFLKSRFFQIARILTAENTFLRAATWGPTSESSAQSDFWLPPPAAKGWSLQVGMTPWQRPE